MYDDNVGGGFKSVHLVTSVFPISAVTKEEISGRLGLLCTLLLFFQCISDSDCGVCQLSDHCGKTSSFSVGSQGKRRSRAVNAIFNYGLNL